MKEKIIIILLAVSTAFFAVLALYENTTLTNELNNKSVDYEMMKQSYESQKEDCDKAVEIIEMLRPYANEEEEKVIEDYYKNKSYSVEEYVDKFNEEIGEAIEQNG